MTASARRRIRAPWLAFPLALLTLLAPAAAAPAFADDAPAPDAAVVEAPPAPSEAPAPDPAPAPEAVTQPVAEPTPEPSAEPVVEPTAETAPPLTVDPHTPASSRLFAAAAAAPVLTVTPASVDPAVATTLTISGTGYTGPGAANGVYVNVGSAADWQPGQVPGQAGWVVSGWVRPNQVVDGAFTTTLTIPAGSLTGGGSYGVASFAANGLSVTDRTLDAWKALTHVVPANPVLAVTPTAVDPAVATTLTISGTGYTGPGAANGVYVNIGSAADWQPGQVPGQAGWIVSGWVRPTSVVDGAFTTTLTVPAGALTAGGSYGIATFAAHGLSATNRTLDAWTALTLIVPATPALTVTPSSIDATVANTLTISGTGYTGPGAASGVYINVGAAADWQPGQVPGQSGWVVSGWVRPTSVVAGAFTTTLVVRAGALTPGGAYGVATFAAHGLSATDRTVDAWTALTVTGPGTGTGTDPGTDPGPGTPAPSLSLSPGTVDPSVATTITVSGSGYQGAGAANGVYVSVGSSARWRPGQVPSDGGWVVSGWVRPGALSNGSFTTSLTIPAGAMTAGGSYGVATFAAHGLAMTNRTLDAWKPLILGAPGSGTATTSDRGAAAEPPADDGLDLETDDPTEGGDVTASATGFEPNEDGILVVVYSDPIVLDSTATADADGTVRWTGRLPAGLTGEHTLTFQGSIDVGAPITIAARGAEACSVEGAILDWGFKESFRSYIDGSIANGEWTTAGDAGYETPSFFWTDGSGDLDPESPTGVIAFDGSVRFTGHGGALDTTIANPRLELDGDSGILLLDVSGTTQDGRDLTRVAVPFATLDLSGLDPARTDGVVALRELPATLTPEGADVFGTYAAGGALDPVTLTLPVAGCEDGAPAEVSASAAAPAADGIPVWLIWAVVAVLLAVAVAAVILRRRRAGA